MHVTLFLKLLPILPLFTDTVTMFSAFPVSSAISHSHHSSGQCTGRST